MSSRHSKPRGDVTHIGRIIPGAADDGRDQFYGWAFDGKHREGVYMLERDGTDEYCCGWHVDDLRALVEEHGEDVAITIPGRP